MLPSNVLPHSQPLRRDVLRDPFNGRATHGSGMRTCSSLRLQLAYKNLSLGSSAIGLSHSPNWLTSSHFQPSFPSLRPALASYELLMNQFSMNHFPCADCVFHHRADSHRLSSLVPMTKNYLHYQNKPWSFHKELTEGVCCGREVKRVVEEGCVNFTALTSLIMSHQQCRRNPAWKVNLKEWDVLGECCRFQMKRLIKSPQKLIFYSLFCL